MEEMVFQIGPIRPPSEANSLLLRVTVNCPWNRCKFCMLYKKYDFHTRSVAEVKKDIDTMAELRDRILQYKTANGWDIQAINNEYQTLTTDDQRWCYQMVVPLDDGGRLQFHLFAGCEYDVSACGLACGNYPLCAREAARNQADYLLWQSKHACENYPGGL